MGITVELPDSGSPELSTAIGCAVQEPRVPGEVGVWVLIFGDLAVFSVFFMTYLVDLVHQPALFASSQAQLSRTLGTANTLLLLTSSLCVSRGVSVARNRRTSAAARAYCCAIGCAVGFVGLKAFEWHHVVANGHQPTTNRFFTYYFMLTGMHLMHVLIGTAVLVALAQTSRAGLLDGRRALVESGACYWHLVDVLWLLMFPLLYLVSLR
jgi:nitric oxide reductase NorE protein